MRRLTTVLAILGLMSACSLNFSSVGTWSVVASPPTQLGPVASVSLADGRVALFGGSPQQFGQPTGQVILFDPVANKWGTGASMPEPVGSGAVIVTLHDGRVLVAGGFGINGLSVDTWLYDPVHNSWARGGNMRVARNLASFATLTDGRVLVAGGSVPLAQPIVLTDGTTINEQAVGSAETFDPATKAWSPAGQLVTARTFMSLVPLPGGMALAAGGCTGWGFTGPIAQGGTGGVFNNAELFDPKAGGWTSTAPMPAPRCAASALSLPDGRAFVVGGDQGSDTTAVIFDPKSHRWTPAGTVAAVGVVSPQAFQGGASAIVLGDGRVLLANYNLGPQQGRQGTAFVGGQIFDPATGVWNFTTTTSVPVSSAFLQQIVSPSAIPLPNGDALVVLLTVAVAFHPAGAAPSTGFLDSIGLTIVLVSAAAALALLLAIAYLIGRRPRRNVRAA